MSGPSIIRCIVTGVSCYVYSDAEYERPAWEVVEDVDLISCSRSKTDSPVFIKTKLHLYNSKYIVNRKTSGSYNKGETSCE